MISRSSSVMSRAKVGRGALSLNTKVLMRSSLGCAQISRNVRLGRPPARLPSRDGDVVGDHGPPVHVQPAAEEIVNIQQPAQRFEGAGADRENAALQGL